MRFNGDVKIRLANKKDVSEIVNIHKKCILDTNSKVYPRKVVDEWVKQISEEKVLNQLNSTNWLVLLVDNKIVGFCQYDLMGEELLQIQVLPEYQGLNCGRSLYNAVETAFNKACHKKIDLFSTFSAVVFYELLGFKRIKPIKFKLDKCFLEMFKMTKEL